MASLKEYRNNELKWFLLANILLMLITTNVFQFDVLEDNFGTYISEFLNIAAISSSAYILTFIFDSIIPSKLKVNLVFLWSKQPSSTIFTDMLKKFEDNRFTLDSAKKKYKDVYTQIENKPKNFDQTPLWYSIYNQHRDNPIVFGSNKDYLLLRDMHAQTIMLLVVYMIFWLVTEFFDFSAEFLIYLIVLIIILNISTRVQGKRMVYHVLSVDVNQYKPVD